MLSSRAFQTYVARAIMMASMSLAVLSVCGLLAFVSHKVYEYYTFQEVLGLRYLRTEQYPLVRCLEALDEGI